MFLKIICIFTLFICCGNVFPPTPDTLIIAVNPKGNTVDTRFNVPSGFVRIRAESTSFTHFLRNLSLKPDTAEVMLYDGSRKGFQDAKVAVIDMEIGKKDLLQCADACIRLRAEYLWKQKLYEEISFFLTNGFEMDYEHWSLGYRLKVEGNKTWWEKNAKPSTTRESFLAYLEKVFTYAGTISLESTLKKVDPIDILPGDVMVAGGSPGHAVMIIDVAVNEANGQKIFMLAQGYMPAQDIHIICNPFDKELSPWYSMSDGAFETMEWTFNQYKIGRF